MEPKSILASKTFWANLIALAAVMAGSAGLDIGVEEQGTLVAGIMAVVNIILRFVTKSPVNMTGAK